MLFESYIKKNKNKILEFWFLVVAYEIGMLLFNSFLIKNREQGIYTVGLVIAFILIILIFLGMLFTLSGFGIWEDRKERRKIYFRVLFRYLILRIAYALIIGILGVLISNFAKDARELKEILDRITMIGTIFIKIYLIFFLGEVIYKFKIFKNYRNYGNCIVSISALVIFSDLIITALKRIGIHSIPPVVTVVLAGTVSVMVLTYSLFLFERQTERIKAEEQGVINTREETKVNL